MKIKSILALVSFLMLTSVSAQATDYHIKSRDTGKLLSVNTDGNHSMVTAAANNDTDDTIFSTVNIGKEDSQRRDIFLLKSKKTGKYLRHSGNEKFVTADSEYSTTDTRMQWVLEFAHSTYYDYYYYIINKSNSMSLKERGTGITDYAKVNSKRYKNSESAHWELLED